MAEPANNQRGLRGNTNQYRVGLHSVARAERGNGLQNEWRPSLPATGFVSRICTYTHMAYTVTVLTMLVQ